MTSSRRLPAEAALLVLSPHAGAGKPRFNPRDAGSVLAGQMGSVVYDSGHVIADPRYQGVIRFPTASFARLPVQRALLSLDACGGALPDLRAEVCAHGSRGGQLGRGELHRGARRAHCRSRARSPSARSSLST